MRTITFFLVSCCAETLDVMSCVLNFCPCTLACQEGTTTAGNALIQFKPGAFLSGMPVQPCVIRYHNERHNPAWVSAGHKVHIILLRMLCEPINWYDQAHLLKV